MEMPMPPLPTTTKQHDAPARRRTGKIPEAVAYSGISRSSLYELAAEHDGLFVKFGASTLVDFDVLDKVIDALPVAEIKSPRPRGFSLAARTKANQIG
jgi:hypothetical protein